MTATNKISQPFATPGTPKAGATERKGDLEEEGGGYYTPNPKQGQSLCQLWLTWKRQTGPGPGSGQAESRDELPALW